jgi:hypothetical protein
MKRASLRVFDEEGGAQMKRVFRILLVAAVLAIGISVSPRAAGTADAAGCVHIYRIYYNSPGTDYGSNYSLNGEWIQLHNVCSSSRSLTYWTIKDAAGHTYRFGSYSLKAYGYVKIHTGKGTNTSTDRYWGSGWYIWNNNTDTAYLRNSNGYLVYKCYYNSTAVSSKYC